MGEKERRYDTKCKSGAETCVLAERRHFAEVEGLDDGCKGPNNNYTSSPSSEESGILQQVLEKYGALGNIVFCASIGYLVETDHMIAFNMCVVVVFMCVVFIVAFASVLNRALA